MLTQYFLAKSTPVQYIDYHHKPAIPSYIVDNVLHRSILTVFDDKYHDDGKNDRGVNVQ